MSAIAITPAAGMLPMLWRKFDDYRLAASMLAEDRLFRYVPVERVPELVQAALGEGRSRADWAADRHGREPRAVAARLSLPVIDAEHDADFGSVVVFAQYLARRPSIVLYRPALRRVDALLRDPEVSGLLGVSACAPIFLAHELYHHFDRTLRGAPLSDRHRVGVVTLGRWQWRSSLTSLDEIAAGAFAQALLGLPFHPRLLELLMLAPADLSRLLELEASA